MNLFLDEAPLTFEKFGMEARLSEDAAIWHQQVLDELYRQVPFASDYNPRVVLQDIDADRRYGLGHIELVNKLAINARDDETPRDLKGSQKVILPIIIQDGKMKPIDLLIHDGKVEPLTEDRLRKALFRPNLYEAIKERPGDMSLIEQLYPPHRQGGSGRGGITADAGAADSKMASVKELSLLDAILPTIKDAHVVEFTDKLASDVVLRSTLIKNAAARAFIQRLGDVEESADGYARLQKVAHAIQPNVIQIQKIAGGFRIKSASTNAIAPTTEDVSRPEAVNAVGGEAVRNTEMNGTQTLTDQPAPEAAEAVQAAGAATVEMFGLYKVNTAGDDRELLGWVFPNLLSLEGEPLSMSAFSNGSEAGLQESIAGIHVDENTDLINSHPEGNGIFYFHTAEGVQGIVPVAVLGVMESPEGESYAVETVMGEKCSITKVPGLQTVTPIEEGRYGIPAESGFIPLEKIVDLTKAEEFSKAGEAKAITTDAVRIITDGSSYSFSGAPIDKLAGAMEAQFLDRDGAAFLGAVLGYHPDRFSSDLVEMRKKASQELWFHAAPVQTLRAKYAGAKKTASIILDKVAALGPMRFNLMKEAAVLEDPSAVDKVLSIGFLNPENISIFAGYIPEFENTIARLSELLMATRLGLQSVDEGAIQKALVHLDKVVAGLKTLGNTSQS